MLSLSDFQTLRRAYSAYEDLSLDEAMERIGNPSKGALVAYAVSQMPNPDRNVRVLMLRCLRHQRGDNAMRGVLAGLQDDTRRVCAVAIQACQNFLAYPAIAMRLEAIARDTSLKRKLRARALSMLAGNEGRHAGDVSSASYEALTRLMAEEEYRFSILFGLVRLELAPRIRQLLEDFARSDDPREGDMARRALAGERVIHIDAYTSDPALRQRITQTCDIARGRMFYWLPTAGIPAKALASN